MINGESVEELCQKLAFWKAILENTGLGVNMKKSIAIFCGVNMDNSIASGVRSCGICP